MRIIAGEWGGRPIRAPKGRAVRPTTDRVREAWMAALGSRIVDARVLDLFAGSGALGLEALSRGAKEVVFVERGRGALRSLEMNVEILGAEPRSRIVQMDVLRFLKRGPAGGFDLALADPPYDCGYAPALLARMVADPFAHELWVEHRSGEAMPAAPGLRQRRYGDTTISIWETPQ